METLTLMQQEHNKNLSSITSKLGDGTAGLLLISMKPAIFVTVHPDTYTVPKNPGTAPTQTAITAADSAKKITNLYNSFALKQKI